MSLHLFDSTLMHLVKRWQHADKEFLHHLFPLLAQGRPVAPSHLADITGRDLAEVNQALTYGRTSRDEEGNVVELFGISQFPAHHCIRVGNVALYSCCALVAQMVPLLLGASVTIDSMDPVNNKLVSLEVSPDGIQSVTPHSCVGTLVITDQAQVLAEISSAFCSHVHHFSDSESAEQFVALDSRRYVVSMGQFHKASRHLYAAIWGNR